MRNFLIYTLIADPRRLKEFTDSKKEMTAVGVNAVTGIFLVLAAALTMSSLFTTGLVILASILFGPLVGFVISSSYPRIEWTVGRRLGGKAALDELYRIFAWSFLPVGFSLLFYSLVMLFIKEPGIAVSLLLAIPSIGLFLLAVRNYCSNSIAVQQFSIKRGTLGLVITVVLFIVLIAGCGSLLRLLYNYGVCENLKAF